MTTRHTDFSETICPLEAEVCETTEPIERIITGLALYDFFCFVLAGGDNIASSEIASGKLLYRMSAD